MGVLKAFFTLLDTSPTFEKHAQVLQVIAARKGQKTSKYIGKTNISRDYWVGIKPKNFAAYIHKEKTKYFQLKLFSKRIFSNECLQRVFLSFKSALLYISICYMAVFTWFLQLCFTVFKLSAYMPSCFDVNVL